MSFCVVCVSDVRCSVCPAPECTCRVLLRARVACACWPAATSMPVAWTCQVDVPAGWLVCVRRAGVPLAIKTLTDTWISPHYRLDSSASTERE